MKMRSKSTMLLKEARSLFWPWFAVTLAGAVSGLPPTTSWSWPGEGWLGLAYSAGFWIGMPLLAARSLGSEFQHRTLPLLLAQPVDRMKIWNTKWSVLSVSVLSSAAVYGLGRRPLLWPEQIPTVAIAWIIISVCSGIFWTLVAKSTIGGLVLNLCQFLIIIGGTSLGWLLTSTLSSGTNRTAAFFYVFGALAYGLVMLWLGRRK